MFILCTSHAENMQTQAVAKVLNFTFGRELGTKWSYNLHPSVCVPQPQPQLRLWLNQLFSLLLKKTQKLSCFPPTLPQITTNVLVLWDPSRSKQTVTSACSLWRKGSQNLNIYGMQCETKIPLLLVLFFRGLFIAAARVFLGCCPAKSDVPQTKSTCTSVAILEPSSFVCAPASQSHAMTRMKYHLLFGLGCPLR